MGATAHVPEKRNYIPCPSGTYVARCVRVVDLGFQEEIYEGAKSIKHKIHITWEFPTCLMTEEPFVGDPYMLSRKLTLSLHENSLLKPLMISWLGRSLTDDELEGGLDIYALCGETCQITVVHNTKDNKTWANVGTVAKLMDGVVVPDQCNEYLVYDHDFPDAEVLKKLPEFVRKRIALSVPDPFAGGSNQPQQEEPPPPEELPPISDDEVL